ARGGEHAEERHVLGLVIADRPRGHGHGAHPEAERHLLLGSETELAQRGERPRAAPQHGHEHAALAAAQPPTWRPSSSIHTATLKPKVAGTACWPCVRPGRRTSLVCSARSASVVRMVASWPRKMSWARR